MALAFLTALGVALIPAQDNRETRGSPTPTPSPTTQTKPDEDKPISIQTDLVTLTLTVQDLYGRYVSNLTPKSFTIFENNVQQEITFFADTDSPASIGIIYDISGSMSGQKISRSKTAIDRFIKTSHPADEYSLIVFNERPQLLVDRTRDGDALADKLTLVKPHGNTALYDAVYLGAEKVTHGTHEKKALIVISDGQDNSSRYTFKELRLLLKETDVIIYSIGIVGSDASNPLGMRGESFLEEISNVTGGRAYFPGDGLEMDEIFERIAIELRHQYSVGYTPNDFHPDGKWRKLKVKIDPPRGMPRLTVRGREGYFATPSTSSN